MERKDEDARRIKNLELAEHGMISLFRDGQLVTNGLPKGSEIKNFQRDASRAVYVFTIWNEAFEPVEPGEEVPTLRIEMLDTALRNTEKYGLNESGRMMY